MPTAAGYIPDVPENIYVEGKGLSPKWWWGTTIPDGTTAPWATAPLGSQYLYKPDESVRPVVFFKVENNESDNDWGSLSFGRQFSGQSMGLLLALTHS